MSIALFNADDRAVIAVHAGREPDDELLARFLASAQTQADEAYQRELEAYQIAKTEAESAAERYAAQVEVYPLALQRYQEIDRAYHAAAAAWAEEKRRQEAEAHGLENVPPAPEVPPPHPGAPPLPPERPRAPDAPPTPPVAPTAERAVAMLMQSLRRALA